MAAAAVLKRASIFSSLVFVLSLLHLFLLVERSGAQAMTDPSEVEALNAMMGRWGLTSITSPAELAWNTTGDPCSGAAIINSTDIENTIAFNPGIICDCTYDRETTCHITKLKVTRLGVTGRVPKELQNLTYLNYLDLSFNYLTGPLPTFIGNLTEMQFLTFGENALSGTIPKELGKLQNLTSLGISINNFSGSLPSELGNLTNLQQLHIDSCGVGGEFPSNVASLKNLQFLWAWDNNFTGKIPDFSETKLTYLYD